jgi:thiamine-monophosphate kinase
VRDGARAAGAALAGGNLARARELSLTLTLLGDVPSRPIGRAGGRPGDHLFVTGTLGGAALGLRSLRSRPSITSGEAVRRWRRPSARLRAGGWLARRGLAAAMIDLSDGLLVDAGRLCAASGVGAVLHVDRLPRSAALATLPRARARALALAGGEDYELLFAVRPARLAALARTARRLGCRITRVGELTRTRGLRLVDAGGRRVAMPGRLGYAHYGAR